MTRRLPPVTAASSAEKAAPSTVMKYASSMDMTTESESEIMRNANRHVLFLLLFIIPFTPERAARQDLSFYALFPGLPETEHSGLIPPTGNVLFSGNAVTDEKRPVKGFFGSGPEKVAFAVVRFRTNRIIR